MTTIPLVILVFRHYILKLRFLKAKDIIDPSETLKSTGMMKIMIAEILVCFIHSPPFLNLSFIVS